MAYSREEKVPGMNYDVTYCTVPKEEQVFKIVWLDTAPSPFADDEMLLGYLKGRIGEVPGLNEATVTVRSDHVGPNGQTFAKEPLTIPLKTQSFGDIGSLIIRARFGDIAENMAPGDNDLIVGLRFAFLYPFLGMHHFRVEAKLPDGRYLFCFKFTQHLLGQWWFGDYTTPRN